MGIDAVLLEVLRCPLCIAVVVPQEGDRGLVCSACGRVYPVEDGIPNMLVEGPAPPATP